MQQKKVLIFSLVYYPRFIGGAEVAVKEITDRIHDIEFDMVTLRGQHESKEEKIGNIMVYRVGPKMGEWSMYQRILFTISKYLYPFLAYTKAKKLEKLKKYDGTWSIMANYAGFAGLFFKLSFPKIPFLLTLQEGDPIPYIKRRVILVYPLFKMIFKKADKVQAISNYLSDFGKSMGFQGVPVVIPNGVDIAHFSKPSEDRNVLRSKWRYTDQDIVLVTASRLVKKNGIGDSIDALTLLPEQYKLLILGTGKLEENLKSKVKELHVEHRVQFLGFISHQDLPAYLQSSDIFIRPSLSEGLGNAFLEAMAAKIPVIATSVGGIPDFLKEGETGLFCNVEDSESIKITVEKLQDARLKTKIVTQANDMVSRDYDWHTIARAMRVLF